MEQARHNSRPSAVFAVSLAPDGILSPQRAQRRGSELSTIMSAPNGDGSAADGRLVKFGLWRSLASALAWGARGPGFKSRQPDQNPSKSIPSSRSNYTNEVIKAEARITVGAG